METRPAESKAQQPRGRPLHKLAIEGAETIVGKKDEVSGWQWPRFEEGQEHFERCVG